MRLIFSILAFLISFSVFSQPMACGENPAMTSFCDEACVICDIDGYTGVNDLTAQGQGFSNFCTTVYNNMQYIAFIAGSSFLSIQVDVGTCVGGNASLELGFFESFDCQTFIEISFCDTDIESGESVIFDTDNDLVIGQYYYMVIDGSNGANCDWTFTVLEGSTQVDDLEFIGEISNIEETCPDLPTQFSTTFESGAAIFFWTVDGQAQIGNDSEIDITFPNEGTYEVCVVPTNSCDEGPQICSQIVVRTIETLNITEILCDGECVEANGNQFCQTGVYQEIITLPNGCDSLINIDIEVLPQPSEMVDLWICNDQFYYIGNDAYNMTGTYTGTVLTANDCDSLVFLDLLVIECEIIGSADSIDVICNGTATGTLIFSVDQGEPPLTYTYTNIIDPTVTGTGMTNLLVNNEIPNIAAGTYQIYITDDFGNEGLAYSTVEEPEVLGVDLTPSDYGGFNLSCFMDNGLPGMDGTLTAVPYGGVPPYNYLWSDGQTTQTAVGLSATNYSVIITDNVTCSMSASFTLTSPSEVIPNVAFNDPTCDGFDTGVIEVLNVSGGTPDYLYSFDNPNNFSPTTSYGDLLEGSYQMYIQDANGCITIVENTITAPDIPVLSFDDDLAIFLGDSIQIFPGLNDVSLATINWTPDNTLNCNACFEPYAMPVNNENYTITVVSEDDCSDSASIGINVTKRRRVYVPNVFSPDNDGFNEVLFINAGREASFIRSFQIYDRWGNKIFSIEDKPINDPAYGWDGKFQDRELNPGLYVWVAEIEFIDGISVIYKGDVSIIR